MARCKAKSKSTGTQCKNGAIADTGVCRMHGGKGALANRGPANHRYSHGRTSRLFKDTRLQERFETWLADPDALQHRKSVAILDTLLEDTLGSINTDAGASERMWEKAARLLQEAKITLSYKEVETRQNLERLEDHINEGLTDAQARSEARKLVQERTSVSKTEIDRLTKLSANLTAEQAMILFQALMNEVSTIKDAKDRARISGNLIKMVGGTA